MKRVHSGSGSDDELWKTLKSITETQKLLTETLSQVNRKVDSLSVLTRQSDTPSYTDPSEYGNKVRTGLPPPEVCIIPRPLSSQAVDSILPSYETCFGEEAGPRIYESNFIERMTHINLDECNFSVHYTDNEYVVGKVIKNRRIFPLC